VALDRCLQKVEQMSQAIQLQQYRVSEEHKRLEERSAMLKDKEK